jgi:hypothetical protein
VRIEYITLAGQLFSVVSLVFLIVANFWHFRQQHRLNTALLKRIERLEKDTVPR